MRAVVVNKVGPPEALEWGELPLPTPGPHDLLVEVHATSVNPVDTKVRLGTRPRQLPLVLGYDLSGIVIACPIPISRSRLRTIPAIVIRYMAVPT